MLTREDDVDIHALRKRGWTISAIARHLGSDRKTIRAYLNGETGRRGAQARPVRIRSSRSSTTAARLVEDPHLWATTLFDELQPLGFDRVVSDVHPQHPGPGAAPGVRAVPPGEGPAGRDHRAPAGRGDPVGLGRAARPARVVGMGVDGASAGRGAGALRAVARGAVPSRWTSRT